MAAVSSRDRKREDYISWEEYFMSLAFLAGQRSKDPELQVGACIVNEKNIVVSLGYNGMPILPSVDPASSLAMPNNDDVFTWQRKRHDAGNNKHLYVCSAAMNAIMFKNSADIKGCTIYMSHFPTNECAKLIIQSGIKKVVYKWHKHKEFRVLSPTAAIHAGQRMLDAAGVQHVQYKPLKKQIVIDFRRKKFMKTEVEPVTKI